MLSPFYPQMSPCPFRSLCLSVKICPPLLFGPYYLIRYPHFLWLLFSPCGDPSMYTRYLVNYVDFWVLSHSRVVHDIFVYQQYINMVMVIRNFNISHSNYSLSQTFVFITMPYLYLGDNCTVSFCLFTFDCFKKQTYRNCTVITKI